MYLPSDIIHHLAEFIVFDDSNDPSIRMMNVFSMCRVSRHFYTSLIRYHRIWIRLIRDLTSKSLTPSTSYIQSLFNNVFNYALEQSMYDISNSNVLALLEPYTIFKHLTRIVLDVFIDDFVFALSDEGKLTEETKLFIKNREKNKKKLSKNASGNATNTNVSPLTLDYLNLESIVYTTSMERASQAVQLWLSSHWSIVDLSTRTTHRILSLKHLPPHLLPIASGMMC